MYTIETAFYFKATELFTEIKPHAVNGNAKFTLDDVKEIVNEWCYDNGRENGYSELHDYFIDYANGDRRFVRISYNGRLCKKYNTRGF